MSALARILVDRDHPVSGSDPRDSATIRQLSASGVQVFHKQTTANIDAVISAEATSPVVVISTAIPETNPELHNDKPVNINTKEQLEICLNCQQIDSTYKD